MLPGNVDPRRPDKVQRYTPKTSNGNGQEDLTTDYMNILGQHPTTANAAEPIDKHAEASSVQIAEPNLQAHEDVLEVNNDELVVATNVIPTSPQYGVAIIPNTTTNDVQPDTEPTDVLIKPSEDGKELHSTPSRNDRFKVVKIASLEPFKRGRWKCMDYVDEVPANTTQSKVAQSSGSIQIQPGGTFLHSTQSLPQHQIQQMLLQTGFVTPFFSGVPAQMLNQGQYFYPQAANMPNQNLNQQVPSSMPAQYINSAQQYIPAGMAGFTMPPNYQNVQYVPTNLIQTQNSAFVPTSQTIQLPANFQQSQTYAGPNVSQTNVTQPLVNGHSYPPQQNEQQVTSCSLPTQTAKSVILNSQPAVSQSQLTQQTVNHIPGVQSTNQTPVPSLQNQYQQTAFQQQQATPALIQVSQVQNFDQSLANNVYTNPQFTMSVNSLTVLDPHEQADNANDANSGTDAANENADDLSKTNPVVNAIDNKIEQAMDLVKSHLMYTVREEVEVLKEKITELYDKIGQLETENSFLRSQVNNQGPVSANANAITNQNAQQSVANASPNTNATSSGSTGTNPNSTEPVQK